VGRINQPVLGRKERDSKVCPIREKAFRVMGGKGRGGREEPRGTRKSGNS